MKDQRTSRYSPNEIPVLFLPLRFFHGYLCESVGQDESATAEPLCARPPEILLRTGSDSKRRSGWGPRPPRGHWRQRTLSLRQLSNPLYRTKPGVDRSVEPGDRSAWLLQNNQVLRQRSPQRRVLRSTAREILLAAVLRRQRRWYRCLAVGPVAVCTH